MTPSKETLEAQVKRFANIVFVACSGVVILLAFVLRPVIETRFGARDGEEITFFGATVIILILASMRTRFALIAIDRQCAKYGHLLNEGSPVCQRCFLNVDEAGK